MCSYLDPNCRNAVLAISSIWGKRHERSSRILLITTYKSFFVFWIWQFRFGKTAAVHLFVSSHARDGFFSTKDTYSLTKKKKNSNKKVIKKNNSCSAVYKKLKLKPSEKKQSQLPSRMKKKTKHFTTLSSGYLGSRNDEERSEMRYVMRIAELRESSNLWTQMALSG